MVTWKYLPDVPTQYSWRHRPGASCEVITSFAERLDDLSRRHCLVDQRNSIAVGAQRSELNTLVGKHGVDPVGDDLDWWRRKLADTAVVALSYGSLPCRLATMNIGQPPFTCRCMPNPKHVMADGRFRVGYFLRKLQQKNQKVWLEQCPDSSLTAVQAGVLAVLLDTGPCSLSELGQSTAIDLSTIRGVVDCLKKRKLLALRKDRDDTRKVVVYLEESGKDHARELLPIMRSIADATMEPLNQAERVAFEFLIEKVILEDTGL